MMDLLTTAKNEPSADERWPIIEAGTAACRLYGPSKTNVADIARFLGKSPASLYRIFPSKAAMWDAIAANFFENDLCFIGSELASARDRLQETVNEQHRLMLRALHGDHQMFKLIVLAASGNWPSFRHYREQFHARVGSLIRDGIGMSEFAPTDVRAATSCFCASILVIWDPRLIAALPSRHCEISAQELVSFAVGALERFHPT
jgi:AcrR family transcriptional regulator